MVDCIFCHKEIPEKDLPRRAKEKIGLQMFWHIKCGRVATVKPKLEKVE